MACTCTAKHEGECGSSRVDKTFAYHKPGNTGVERIQRIREAYSDLKRAIEAQCPPSRERSVAITELETSAMWATKAIVVNDPESEVTP